MSIFDLSALAAAFCVALSNLIAPPAVRHLGPIVFNCWRLGAALLALALITTLRGSWTMFSLSQVLALVGSSLIGITIGDSAVYAAMYRQGPRRASMLYATNAPFAAVLGFVILGEDLGVSKVIGISLVVVGVWIAISYRDPDPTKSAEEVRGSLVPGIAFGLLGGLSAALAALIARPIMAQGVDPFAAAAVRAAVGLVALSVLARVGERRKGVMNIRVLALAAISGLLGMAAGMTLVLFALSMRPIGVVTTLASTTPVLLLPLLWAITRKRPAPQAWLGAVLAVAGVASLSGAFV